MICIPWNYMRVPIVYFHYWFTAQFLNWLEMCCINISCMWGYFWPRPKALTFCQSPCTKKREWVVVVRRVYGSDHTPMHINWSQQRKQISARRCVPTAVWVTDCLSIRTAHSTNGSFCLYLDRGTKEQLKCVCVRWLQHSTAFFSCSIHTQIQGYWHSGAVKSHKRTKNTTWIHTGSMGKFLSTSKREGRSSTSWKKRTFSTGRLKNTPKHSLNTNF